MKVKASNGRKFDETGFPLIVFRASFTSKIKFYANFLSLLTNVCQSHVYLTNTGLIEVVV
jgi:hypothetical protein